jgi:hypothetical protein
MKVRLVLACALAGAALAVGTAGTASATEASEPRISFSATVVEPGAAVQISGVCDVPKFPPTPVRSTILDVVNLVAFAHTESGWLSSTEATVRPDADRGRYPVSFVCGGTTVTGYLQVRSAPKPPFAAIGVTGVIEPGREILVGARCQDPDFVESAVESPVLTAAGNLVRKAGDPIEAVMSVLAKIDDDAKPGTYPISFHCVDRNVTGEFTVSAPGEPPAPGEPSVPGEPSAPGGAQPQVPVKPQGPADTGSLQPADSGDGTAVVAVGVAALLAAVVGSTAIVRRRGRA